MTILLLVLLALVIVGQRDVARAYLQGSGQIVKQVSSGNSHACAIAGDNKAYCWGSASVGRLGNGVSSGTFNTPVAVTQGAMPVGSAFRQIVTGASHSCTIASDGKAYCWGLGNNGRLGDGSAVNVQTSPVAVLAGAIPAGQTILQMTAANLHTCAIATDNKAYCWGSALNGRLGNGVSTGDQATPVAVSAGAIPAGVGIKQISAGNLHTCAVGSDSKAYCWGSLVYGRLGNGVVSSGSQATPVAVSAGAIPTSVVIKQVSAGDTHTCALASDGKVYCWGDATGGRLGNGTTGGAQSAPVAVLQGAMPAGSIVRQLFVGATHSCVLVSDGKTYCWGSSVNGQVGDGSGAGSVASSPVEVARGSMTAGSMTNQLLSDSSVANSTCSIGSDNKAYCWGSGAAGNLGNGTNTASQVTPNMVSPMIPKIPVSQSVYRLASSSSSHNPGNSLAADNTKATLSTVAGDFRLRLGITNEAAPRLDQIGSGIYLSCATASADSRLYCWGNSPTANKPLSYMQANMASGTTVRQLSTSGSHGCVVASDSKVYCFGQGAYGQLGGSAAASGIAQGEIPVGALMSQVTTSIYNSCAISSIGKAYCWGHGANGILGNGTSASVNQATPVAVTQGSLVFQKIWAGDYHACAITTDGKAYCWGSGSNGRLGNNNTSNQTTPTQVLPGSIPAGVTFVDIAPAKAHTCALASDSKVYCWGAGGLGQLGNGTTTASQLTPTAISQGAMPAGTTVLQISSGGDHTCVIASDNKTYCWGSGTNGMLGNGLVANQSSPVAVSAGAIPAGVTARTVSAGYNQTCMIGSDDNGYCWGQGTFGQLASGASPTTQTTPVAMIYGDTVQSGPNIGINNANLQLQVASKGAAATCSAVTNGWNPVSASSSISWGAAPPSNGTNIYASSSDPAAPSVGGYSFQTVVQSGTSFTNSSLVSPLQTGLWDFVLRDISQQSAASYCFRVVATNAGETVDIYSNYPEITTATGSLGLQFVNASGSALTGTATDTPFSSLQMQNITQTSVGWMTNTTNKQLEVFNSLSSTGWNVSLASTLGPTAKWQSGANNYPYNASTAALGQLSVNMTGSSVTAFGTTPNGTACSSVTGITKNSSNTPYVSGSVDAITLLSGSATAGFNCGWRIQNAQLSQTIPASQLAGNYSLDITATVVAQ